MSMMSYGLSILLPERARPLGKSLPRGELKPWHRPDFHSQVVNAAALCYVLANNPTAKKSLEMVRLAYQIKAVRLVQEAINSVGSRVPSVAVICIMDLSVSAGAILEVVPVERIPEYRSSEPSTSCTMVASPRLERISTQ
jgi:hypothetical protein